MDGATITTITVGVKTITITVGETIMDGEIPIITTIIMAGEMTTAGEIITTIITDGNKTIIITTDGNKTTITVGETTTTTVYGTISILEMLPLSK